MAQLYVARCIGLDYSHGSTQMHPSPRVLRGTNQTVQELQFEGRRNCVDRVKDSYGPPLLHVCRARVQLGGVRYDR